MYYKLTDKNLKTHGGFQWEIGKWYETPEADFGNGLCSPSYFHCYNSPLLAVLLNPIHANIENPKLFEIEVDGKTENDKLKFGFTKMKLVKEILLPVITIEQKVKFAIYCALEVYENEHFVNWAQNWLSGKDRSKKSANTAVNNAYSDAKATKATYADVAAYNAAYNATYAADYASVAADVAAYNAAYAADYASVADVADYAIIDFVSLAKKACN